MNASLRSEVPVSEVLETVSSGPEKPVVETLIDSSDHWLSLRLTELWNFRELLYFLAWRDIKVRYQQTIFGCAWAMLQPLAAALVFTIIFSRIAKVPSEGIPYPVFVLAGLAPWQLFTFVVNESTASLVTNQNLIKKVYFPRMLIPIATVLVALVDCALSLVVLAGVLLYYRVAISPGVLLLIPFLLMGALTALGIGLWLSALNIQYRDVRHLTPFLTQLWLFATPVAYPASMVPMRWKWVYELNPMAGVVEGFRWAILGTGPHPGPENLLSAAAGTALLISGVLYFKRMEKWFADVV